MKIPEVSVYLLRKLSKNDTLMRSRINAARIVLLSVQLQFN